jgi:organic radical activating enzyme
MLYHDVAEQLIAQLQEDQIFSIILSGGWPLHPEFVEWIKELCKRLNLSEPHFTKGMEIQFG